jgi:Cytochrome c554 and c-prime
MTAAVWAAKIHKIVIAAIVILMLAMAIATRADPQAHEGDSKHLGVRSCSGDNCHGAVKPAEHSAVKQNEYLIWSQESDPYKIDKHHRAYTVLGEERGVRMAHNLGLKDAITAEICLNCHADNVPEAMRGPRFDISDGVGCEACHGAAEKWLGVHLSGAGHQANLDAGLYPTEKPVERAEKCLSCHFGDTSDEKRFVTHRIMGAGHPRMGFELDTYTTAEPAHFTVNEKYTERKGPVNDVQVWAVGQAISLGRRMDALLDPKNAPKEIQPELVLFDCAACHHTINQIRWRPRDSTGLGPGTVKLDDANAVMLRVIAARVAPTVAKALTAHMLALHRATTEDWKTVVREATEVRRLANELQDSLSAHEFTRDDMKALAEGVIAVGLTGDDTDFPGAEQATMALGSIASAMSSPIMPDHLTPEQTKLMNNALGGLYKSISNAEDYRPEAFVKALKDFQRTIPQ